MDPISLRYTVTTASGNMKISANPPYNIATVTIEPSGHVKLFRCRIVKEGGYISPQMGLLVNEQSDLPGGQLFSVQIDSLSHFLEGEGVYQVGLFAQNDEGKWNWYVAFITVSGLNFKTKDGEQLTVAEMSS